MVTVNRRPAIEDLQAIIVNSRPTDASDRSFPAALMVTDYHQKCGCSGGYVTYSGVPGVVLRAPLISGVCGASEYPECGASECPDWGSEYPDCEASEYQQSTLLDRLNSP